MLEVTANLVRGSVYLAGEEIECQITVYNSLDPARLPRSVCPKYFPDFIHIIILIMTGTSGISFTTY
jgi:hypothetical protein